MAKAKLTSDSIKALGKKLDEVIDAANSKKAKTWLDELHTNNPKQVNPSNKHLFEFDAESLIPTEGGVKNIDNYKGDPLKPITVTETDQGFEILDGHHRAEIARQAGERINGIVIPSSDVVDMREKGIHQGDMLKEWIATGGPKRSSALDMSQSARMQRAKDMGFDTDKIWYHGTGDDFEEFASKGHRFAEGSGGPQVKGHWFTESVPEANRYAGSELTVETGAGNPIVIPAHLKARNIVEVDSRWDVEDALQQEGVDAVRVNQDDLGRITGTPQSWMVVKDPSNIRSVNAAFDPAQKESANLLAEAGTGIALGSMALPNTSAFAERRKARGGTRRQRRLAQQEQRAREAQEQAFTEMIQNTPTDYDNRDTIQGAQYPFLGNVANTIRDIETPIGYPLRGAANWLDKINYGDDIGIMDRLEAIPDATEATIAINKVFGLDDDS